MATILGNSIHSNGRLGIDLVAGSFVGVTPNDPGDPDTGVNGAQNYPVVTGASGDAISATLNSTPSTLFRVEFFSNVAANPSGFGDGQTYLGFVTVTTDAAGNTGAFTFASPTPIAGRVISATATDPGGNTSEFSGDLPVPPATPVPVANPDAYSLEAGGTLSVLVAGVLGNDTAVGRGPLGAVLVVGPTYGALTLNADGSFTYTPAAGYSGPDGFTYRATEGATESNVASVSLTVTAVPPVLPPVVPPVAPPVTPPVLPPTPARHHVNLRAVGADYAGGPRARAYGTVGAVVFDQFVYESTFTGGSAWPLPTSTATASMESLPPRATAAGRGSRSSTARPERSFGTSSPSPTPTASGSTSRPRTSTATAAPTTR